MTRRVVTIFGGSGLIGRAAVAKFAHQGWVVRVAVRHPNAAGYLLPLGDVGQIVLLCADIRDKNAVAAAVSGAQTVVNLVGILAECGGRTFDSIHVQGAANVAEACRDAGVGSLVHVSALGASKNSPARYAQTKAEGEAAVVAAFPQAVILRPSVVFGADDDFFNRFATMAVVTPALPVFTRDGLRLTCGKEGGCVDLYGSGGPVFQPVWVADVAEAIVKTAGDPACDGRVFELGGPRRYSLKEVLEFVLWTIHRRRLLVPLPFWVARLMSRFLQFVPGKPLTPDQVRLMETDNVVRGGRPGLAELGISPTAADDVVPQYLARFRRGYVVQ